MHVAWAAAYMARFPSDLPGIECFVRCRTPMFPTIAAQTSRFEETYVATVATARNVWMPGEASGSILPLVPPDVMVLWIASMFPVDMELMCVMEVARDDSTRTMMPGFASFLPEAKPLGGASMVAQNVSSQITFSPFHIL